LGKEEFLALPQQAPSFTNSLRLWLRAIRVHQWLKNLLLFAPFLAAHQQLNQKHLFSLLLAFFAFSVIASGTYLLNDLMDLESDRSHPTKSNRPFASGALSKLSGRIVGPSFILVGLFLAILVGHIFLVWSTVYLIVTILYSKFFKQLEILDCILLACLYYLRIIAGAAATSTHLSFYLSTFAVFIFLSLAFVKRYAELIVRSKMIDSPDFGRGYLISDAPLIQVLGVSSGYAAVIVFSLYLNSDLVRQLYVHAQWLWAMVPILLYWISWMWLQAHRGLMADDPLVFAVRKRESLISGVIFFGVLLISYIGVHK
jgi:4-hydroxybenzoate polyprenyltransferase